MNRFEIFVIQHYVNCLNMDKKKCAEYQYILNYFTSSCRYDSYANEYLCYGYFSCKHNEVDKYLDVNNDVESMTCD